MFDPIENADQVSRWTGLGVTLPEHLAKAVETFETLRYVEVGYQPVFDIDAVTAENAEAAVRAFAEELAIADQRPGSLSVLEQAKRAATTAAANRVTALARGAIRNVIEQLTPTFEQRAAKYVEAVSKLPDDLSAETLVAAGADAVVAYGEAQREARYLQGVDSWVAGTGYLTGHIMRDMEVATRMLHPATLVELTQIDAALHKSHNTTIAALNPLFYTAARSGVEFRIHSLAEATQLRRDIEGIARQRVDAFN